MRVSRWSRGRQATGVRPRGIALALLVGTLLVGCNDADGEAPQSTASAPSPDTTTAEIETDVSATPAPGPTPWPEPTRPEAMARDDIEGAKAAAEYFLALYPYVYVTGDLSEWNEITHPECMFCAGVVENVEELHGAGGYADGPAIDIREIDAEAPSGDREFYSVWIDAIEHPSSRFDGSGEVLGTSGGSDIAADMAMEWTGEGWRVRGAVVTPEEGEA